MGSIYNKRIVKKIEFKYEEIVDFSEVVFFRRRRGLVLFVKALPCMKLRSPRSREVTEDPIFSAQKGEGKR